MSREETNPLTNKKQLSTTTSFRWHLRRGRRKLPTVRLGGKKARKGFFLVRLCRKAKLKWVKLKYVSMLRQLKKYYDSFLKDMLEGSRSIESFQQRMMLETSFAVPVMGLSFTTYPSGYFMDQRPVLF